MQDILKTIIQAHQDTAYYEDLIAQCQSQLDAANAQEKRMETALQTITEQQQQLEQQLIEAWDNPDTFRTLSADYAQLQTVFTIAPKAFAYWQKRAHELRHKLIVLKSQRSNAQLEARQAAEAARLEAERQKQIQAEIAEREQRQQKREAERRQQQETIAAMNAAKAQQTETVVNETNAFIDRIKEAVRFTPIRKDKQS